MTNQDRHHRSIDYLRISVTDRCNLRCLYCMPEEGIRPISHDEILSYEEIETVVRAAVELGISKFRLTGGEPLVRLGLVDLVAKIAAVPGVRDLAMTTNGTLLARHAEELAQAGLNRVNVSLDTLRPERFREITRWGSLEDTLAGIAAAHQAGLKPVKINTVVIRGLNDEEVVDLARKTIEDGWYLRFIEWMPISEVALKLESWNDRVVTAAEIKSRVEATLGPLSPVAGSSVHGPGPARYYRFPGAKGVVGFITPVSDHFCDLCNRLRLTADGQLRPCLLAPQEIDLRTPLRKGAGVPEIKELLVEAIRLKPRGHNLSQRGLGGDAQSCTGDQARAMAQIGG
ncbi:MAG: GTP 3',8-cyclase MoaA [Anaerolineae bacterium]